MSSAESLNDNVDQTKADASNSFAQLKDDVTKVAQSAVDAGRQKVDQFKGKIGEHRETLKGKLSDGRDAAQDAANRARDAAQDAAYRARDKGQDLLTNLQEQIAEKPIQSVAIAAGVGVILGIVLRRR